MEEFSQSVVEVVPALEKEGKMVSEDGAGPDHQNGEDKDPSQDHHPQEDTGGPHLQGEGDQGHHRLDTLEDHDQSLLTRRNLTMKLVKRMVNQEWKRQ